MADVAAGVAPVGVVTVAAVSVAVAPIGVAPERVPLVVADVASAAAALPTVGPSAAEDTMAKRASAGAPARDRSHGGGLYQTGDTPPLDLAGSSGNSPRGESRDGTGAMDRQP